MNKTFTYTEINHDNFKFQHLAHQSNSLGQVLEHVQHYLKKSQHRIVIKVKGLDITFYFSKTPNSKPAILSQSHPKNKKEKNFNTWLTKVLIETIL